MQSVMRALMVTILLVLLFTGSSLAKNNSESWSDIAATNVALKKAVGTNVALLNVALSDIAVTNAAVTGTTMTNTTETNTTETNTTVTNTTVTNTTVTNTTITNTTVTNTTITNTIMTNTTQSPRLVLYRAQYKLPLDKQQHILAGMAVMAASQALKSHHAIELVALVGVGKEVYDHFFGGHVELLDALATLGGGLLYRSLFY